MRDSHLMHASTLVGMGEVAKRAATVVANAAGGTAGPAVTALMTAAGVALGKPGLALAAIPGGALVGALTEEGVNLVAAVCGDRVRRVGRFAESASKEFGKPIEDIMTAAAEHPEVRELLAEAVDAASVARDDWLIDVFARAFVRGAEDGAVVDEMLKLIAIVRQLDVADVRLLAAICAKRESGEGARVRAGSSSVEEILDADPGLQSVLPVLMQRSESLGLIKVKKSKSVNLDDLLEEPAGLAKSHSPRQVITLTVVGGYVAGRLEKLGHGLPNV